MRLGADAREVLSPSKDSDKQIWKAFLASASQRHRQLCSWLKPSFTLVTVFLMSVGFSIKTWGNFEDDGVCEV